MSDWQIRTERASDYQAVEEVVREAFWDVYRPGCGEHAIVARLRKDAAFLPEFSVVAEKGSNIIGMIAYSRGVIRGDSGQKTMVASFGPLAVLPEFQRRGLGAALVRHTIPLVRAVGFSAIVLYGDGDYYARFGFEPGEKFGVTDAFGEFCPALLVLPLHTDANLAGRFVESDVFHLGPEEIAAFDRTFPPKAKHANSTQLFLGFGAIRPTTNDDFDVMGEIINDAATAYRGVIPADCWREPYMPAEELRAEIAAGVQFYGFFNNGLLLGVMGIQDEGPVNLLRHAYVRTIARRRGIGAQLLEHIKTLSAKPLLVGTWRDAIWAIRFYEKHGFVNVDDIPLKDALLRQYWTIPERQVETSTVLTDSPEGYLSPINSPPPTETVSRASRLPNKV